MPRYIAWRGHSKSLIPPRISHELIDSILGFFAFRLVELKVFMLPNEDTERLVVEFFGNDEKTDKTIISDTLNALQAIDPIIFENNSFGFRHKSYQISYCSRHMRTCLMAENLSSDTVNIVLASPDAAEIISDLFLQIGSKEKKDFAQLLNSYMARDIINIYPEIWDEIFKKSTEPEHYPEIIEAIEAFKSAELRFDKRRRDIIVISIHGINTRGEWKNTFSSVLGRATDGERYIHHPWDYGDFVYKVLNPISRYRALRNFQKLYNNVISQYENRPEICVVAHSFGTFIIGRSLLLFPEVKINRLILLGSLLSRNYPWRKINRKCARVRNEIGGSDLALIFAKFLPGFGTSGRDGFVDSPEFVEQVYYEHSGHSDGFGRLQMVENWLPFLGRKNTES